MIIVEIGIPQESITEPLLITTISDIHVITNCVDDSKILIGVLTFPKRITESKKFLKSTRWRLINNKLIINKEKTQVILLRLCHYINQIL